MFGSRRYGAAGYLFVEFAAHCDGVLRVVPFFNNGYFVMPGSDRFTETPTERVILRAGPREVVRMHLQVPLVELRGNEPGVQTSAQEGIRPGLARVPEIDRTGEPSGG